MIKLMKLIQEHEGGSPPFMYSPVGFSCAVCEYLVRNKDEDRWVCTNKDYQEWAGTHYLNDENGQPIEDPKKWCSNWFEPKTK